MFTILFSQINKVSFITLIVHFLIVYNLYQLIQQTQLTFFLGYKLLLIIYIGWILIYYDLDIMAFILWIVYGSFIVVIFIFSFMWLNLNITEQVNALFNKVDFFMLALFSIIIVVSKSTYVIFQWHIFMVSGWINYYELLAWSQSEEIECLGWGLSTENMCGLLIASIILTFASITAISMVIVAKKNKWASRNIILKSLSSSHKTLFTSIRTQHMYQQEKNNMVRLNKVIKSFHRRRT